MLTYQDQSVDFVSNVPTQVQQHIMGIVDAGPMSKFNYHITLEVPNVHVYLIERNPLEGYTLCHVFSCDQIGQDYSYQHFSESQVITMNRLFSKPKPS